MRRKQLLAAFAVLSLLLMATTNRSSEPVSECVYSSLWGVNGEKWDEGGRLPDFSYAGYHAGEQQIPAGKLKWDFKRDFHAVGDGHNDDSAALSKAISTIRDGVLF